MEMGGPFVGEAEAYNKSRVIKRGHKLTQKAINGNIGLNLTDGRGNNGRKREG